MKSKKEISDAWNLIFERRRLAEKDDQIAIFDREVLKGMYTAWMNEWIATGLTVEQAQRGRNKQTSVFAAYINNTVGGKNFLMAVWQSGITWAPSAELLNTNYDGALEHVATNFASWVRRVARAIRKHKEDPDTVEARTRSGSAWGEHGLSRDEDHLREVRREARRNYFWALKLDRRLRASKGMGKGDAGKGKQKGKGKHGG